MYQFNDVLKFVCVCLLYWPIHCRTWVQTAIFRYCSNKRSNRDPCSVLLFHNAKCESNYNILHFGLWVCFFVHLRYLTLTLLMAIIYKTHTKIDKINLGAFARTPYNFIKSLWRLLQITSHYPMTDRGEKTS